MQKDSGVLDFRRSLLSEGGRIDRLNDVSRKYIKSFLHEIDTGKIKTIEVTQCQCRSARLERLTKVDRFGLPFGALICQDCGLVVTSPRLRQESLPYYYTSFYHQLIYGQESLANRHSLYARGQGNKVFRLVKDLIAKKAKIDVLEVGAGTGSVLQEFKEEASENNMEVNAVGTEYSDECIGLCEQKDITAIKGDLEDIVSRKSKFDVVILSHVFEHFIDLDEELENVSAVLKEDGVLYIEVPGMLVNHKRPEYDFSFVGYLIHAHMYGFTLDTLFSTVARSGFDLQYGNEEIEAVFQKKSSDFSKNSYKEILEYLSSLYKEHETNKSSYLNMIQEIRAPASKEKGLFIYLDPGFTSGLGHYRNFAEKIHGFAERDSIDVYHYVNKGVYQQDRKAFDLYPVFEHNAYIDEKKMSLLKIESKLHDFRDKVEMIFQQIKKVEAVYKKSLIYMYTCHWSHAQVLLELYEKYGFTDVHMHMVLFYLNENIILGNKDKAAVRGLEEVNRSNRFANVFLHIDSNRAIFYYQRYFDKTISPLPIPLRFAKDVRDIDGHRKKDKTTIAFFGYADRKYGFHLFYEMYAYFSSYFTYIVRINSKIHDPEFDDKIEVLRHDINVQYVDSYIEQTEYRRLFRKSDIVVIPYSKEGYPAQTSGVCIDAIWEDRYIVTTEDTWMADQVDALGNGTLFKDDDAEALIQAILLADKSRMVHQSTDKREGYKRSFTVERLFEKLGENSMDDHEAYKEKDHEAIIAREKKHNDFLRLSRRINKESVSSLHHKHLVYPSLSTIDQLEELLHRLTFALPQEKHISIVFPVPDWFDEAELSRYEDKYSYVSFIREDELKRHIAQSVILIHDADGSLDLDLFKTAARVEIIDKEFFSNVEAETLRKLYFKTISPQRKREYLEISKENFVRFQRKNSCKKQAFCFTSGPSFDSYKELALPTDALKVICNSIVKNDDFLQTLDGADVLAFGDPVFHFGPSEYARQFREDVMRSVERFETFLVIPEINMPLMLAHYPHLKDKIIALPGKGVFNFPSQNDLFVKNTANILTLFMIPIASAIADTIFIMGADGRKEEENYFWKHSSSVQYDANMEDAFRMHPSFFRDRDYKDYYKEHCELLADQIAYGESLGKMYASVTPSYIPALKARRIDMTKSNDEVCKEIEERREDYRSSHKRVDEPGEDVKTVNYDFSLKMNRLYTYVSRLKASKSKIAIYGNGLIGQIMARELKEQVVVIVDQDVNSVSDVAKTCTPLALEEHTFDKMVITVLGREGEIIKATQIAKEKIYKIDLTRDAPCVVTLDRTSKESLEENLCGPYTRESELSVDETVLVSKYIQKDNGVMIDVGAHQGSSARPFLEKGWVVYGYEPDPSNRKRLEENLNAYDDFFISDKAVSDEADQTVDFYTSQESTGISGLSSFTKGHKKTGNVLTTTLSEEMKTLGIDDVDFLKIDTEGYDLMVLKGFSWETCKPKVIECEFEDHKTTPLGYDVYDLVELLFTKGYHIYVSEWYPIVRYGVRHQWKRFFKYSGQRIDPGSWGNLLAFIDTPDERHLLKNLYEIADIED